MNEKEQLEELKKLLYLYHDCGTNAKKYLKYYEDNTLNEKLLNKGYSEYEISLILEYMNDFSKQQISDEKGQSKVLKIKDITSNSI